MVLHFYYAVQGGSSISVSREQKSLFKCDDVSNEWHIVQSSMLSYSAHEQIDFEIIWPSLRENVWSVICCAINQDTHHCIL